ncbi:MAG: carboxypeptidase regulatory-like domain-containing protein [Planctomycetes bacterium]|nr:carboxypeptidase regulatory-like domain-containing protein [Planctomycetota bacterium]
MRAFALSLLIVLAAGIAFLLWKTTSVLVATPPTERSSTRDAVPAVDTDAELDPSNASTLGVSAVPSPAAPSPASAERGEVARSSAPTRESALDTLAARVFGNATAVFVRAPGRSREDDPAGRRPIPGVVVTFLNGDRVLARVESGRDGRFEARFETAGTCALQVAAPAGWRPANVPSTLSRAVLEGGRPLELAFLTAETEIAGEIRGVLHTESGAWCAETLPKRGAVLLDLVSVSDPFFSMRAEVENGVDARGAPTVEFVFREVPRGEYELTLSALDGFRWHPKSQRATPPAAGLSFLRYDKEQSLPLVFHVFDARTHEPITDFEARRLALTPSHDNGVFLHTGPIELGTFPAQGTFQWSLWADDHAAAFGDETSFVEQAGARVAEVLLEPGWSTKVLVLARDPTARPLANAEVWLDGARAGRTNAEGMVVLRAKERPKTLDVRADGFAVVGKPLEGHAGKTAEQRGQVTLVFVEPKR